MKKELGPMSFSINQKDAHVVTTGLAESGKVMIKRRISTHLVYNAKTRYLAEGNKKPNLC